jgi:hypothetical protein
VLSEMLVREVTEKKQSRIEKIMGLIGNVRKMVKFKIRQFKCVSESFAETEDHLW